MHRSSALLFVALLLSQSVHAQTTVAGITPGSFRVTESGAAEHRIPIRVPPGIAGMEPKLALAYNSQSGNGPLGVGWQLEGLSAITRCPKTTAQDGVRGGINYDDQDRFCLDSQRLMVISGIYGAAGSEYRTERESFSKIVAQGGATGDPTWFEVRTKTGQILQYGNDTAVNHNSRVLNTHPTTPKARVWALNRVADTKGNYIKFSYAAPTASGEYRPDKIEYTGNLSGQSPSQSVEFVYHDGGDLRTDVAIAYIAGLPVTLPSRLKQIKTKSSATDITHYNLSYKTGNSVETYRSVLDKVQECQGSAPTTCMPLLQFGWQAGASGFAAKVTTTYSGDALAGYELQTGDFDGDGRLDLLYISDGTGSLEKGRSRIVFLSTGGGNFGSAVVSSVASVDYGGFELRMADFNGDGRTDIIYASDGSGIYGKGTQRRVLLSNGDGTFAAVVSSSQTAVFSTYSLHIGDFDGDGRADLIYFYATSTVTYRSVFLGNGAGGFGPRLATSVAKGFAGYAFILGDFNGDGRTDILHLHTTPGDVGRYRSIYMGVGDGTFGGEISSFQPDNFVNYELEIGDVNGDRLPDIIYVSANTNIKGRYRNVFLSKGDGTFADKIYSTQSVAFGYYSLRSGDFNGDGKLDLLYTRAPYSGERSVFLGKGDGTFGDRIATSGNTAFYSGPFLSEYEYRLGDFNGDGKTDVLDVSTGYTTMGQNEYGEWVPIWVSTAGVGRSFYGATPNAAPDVVTSIPNGLGAATTVTYKSLSDGAPYYEKCVTLVSGVCPAFAPSYPVVLFRGPMFVVSSYAVTNGLGGTVVTNHSYKEARVDVAGRGMIGFLERHTEDVATGIKSLVKIRTDWPYAGLTSQSVRSQPGGAVLSQADYTYACSGFGGTLGDCSLELGKRYFPSVQTNLEHLVDLNSAFLSRVCTRNEYDTFGNATKVDIRSLIVSGTCPALPAAVTGGTGHSKVTNSVFTNNTTDWFLGRLTSSEVVSTVP